MMKKFYLMMIAIIATSIVSVNAQSLSSIASSATNGSELTKDLMKAAQVDEKQAMGGAGALFEMAKENMNAEDFSEVTKALPEATKMMEMVPNVAGKSSALNSAATALTGMPKVKAVFNKLGISDDKVALFTPILVKYVEKNGSKLLGQKLSKSLKP
jgi:hypothetical protein